MLEGTEPSRSERPPSLKFGALIRYYQWLGYDSAVLCRQLELYRRETQNPSAATKGGDAFADFLLGYPASVGRAYPRPTLAVRAGTSSSCQDDIHVSEKLTVNIGLRYEYTPWPGRLPWTARHL